MTLCVNKTHRIVHRILGLQTCMSERLLELFRAPGQRTTKPWLDSFLPLAKLPWSETPQVKQWNLCPPAAHGRISTILSPTLHQLPFGHPALYGTGVHFANADLANHLHQSEMQRLCSKSWREAITLQSAEGNLSCWHSISIPFWEEKVLKACKMWKGQVPSSHGDHGKQWRAQAFWGAQGHLLRPEGFRSPTNERIRRWCKCCTNQIQYSNPPRPVGAKGRVFPEALARSTSAEAFFKWNA